MFHRLADNERVLRQGVFGATVIPKQKFIKYFPRLIRLRQLMDDWSDQQRVLEEESNTNQIDEKVEEDVNDSIKSTGSTTSIDEKEKEDVDE